MIHSFDTEIAAAVGVNAATIYQNILFWAEKNAANGRHIHDEAVWTYNSVKAWGQLFPYLSTRQIRTALEKLVQAELIVEGNYNPSGYDRTKWYGIRLCHLRQMDLSKMTNGFVKSGEPIPDSKPVSKPDSNLFCSFDDFWDVVPKKVGKGQARRAWKAAVKKEDPDAIISAMKRYAASRKGEDPQYTAHPSTWLNGERWGDEVQATSAQKNSNFFDNLDQHLANMERNDNGLPRPNSDFDEGAERLPAPNRSAEAFGRGWDAGRDEADRGNGKQTHLSLIKPRRL